VSLLVHEVVAIGVATVTLDDTARSATSVAVASYRADRSLTSAHRAAAASAAEGSAEVVTLEELDGELVVALTKRARTLLLHRVAPLEDLATATATRRAGWRS
jgi:BMFP domain-containing protein YqiC